MNRFIVAAGAVVGLTLVSARSGYAQTGNPTKDAQRAADLSRAKAEADKAHQDKKDAAPTPGERRGGMFDINGGRMRDRDVGGKAGTDNSKSGGDRASDKGKSGADRDKSTDKGKAGPKAGSKSDRP